MLHVALLATLALGAASPASATLLTCERDAEPAAEFEARMATAPDTDRMRMRFTLQASTPERPAYRRVAAPGFDIWSTSEPGTTRYVYTRRVEALIGPAQYRVKVRFRWLDANGETIAHTVRYSRPCRVPDVRPNLVIRSLSIEPVRDRDLRRYVALVRNTGHTAAEPFDVQLGSFAPVTVEGLDPGREREVELVRPACEPDEPVTAVVDPGDAVEERSEADNTVTEVCP
jgi:hypothetical protein